MKLTEKLNIFFFQVLSLPSNFTYNPPGIDRTKISRQPSVISQGRRKTLHCPQQIYLTNFDDIKSIDESTSDIYNIRDTYRDKNSLLQNYDDIITINAHPDIIKVVEDTNICQNDNYLKLPNEKSINDNILKLPSEQKPMHKLYGSTKHLFRQKSIDLCNEETPFIQVSEETDRSEPITNVELKFHDSQESVQRIISERRKLDENLKDINEFDIFEQNDGRHDTVECVVIQDNTISDIEVVIEEDTC